MNKEIYHSFLESPIGLIQISASLNGITGVRFTAYNLDKYVENDHSINAKVQLDEYFHAERNSFDLPLILSGSSFQLRVWQQLQSIKYGQTISYSTLAILIHQDKAYRAVGNAIGANPLLIIVPCHRVIASNQTLGGYSGGVDNKKWLLEFEKDLL